MAFPSDLEIEVAFDNNIDETSYAQTGWTSILPFVSSFSGDLRGRAYELDRAEAGSLSVVLDNSDGRFIPGSVKSPYYPNVKSDRRFRIRGKNMVHPNVARGGSRDHALTGFLAPASANYTANVYSFDNVRTITANAEPNAGQGKEKVHDGSGTTYWSINTQAGWIQYQFALAIQVLTYTVQINGGDMNRAPKTWTLKGSNDNSIFTTLHTVTANTWAESYERQTFAVTSPGFYLYYRLDITANIGNVTNTEVAEWDVSINYADVLDADLSHYTEIQLNANRANNDWYETIGWYGPLEYGTRLTHSAKVWRISGTEPAGGSYKLHMTYLDKDLNQVGASSAPIVTGNPKTSTLVDDWRSLESARYPSSQNVTVLGGNSSQPGRIRLNLPAVGNTARINTLPNRYDLTSSQLAMEFAVLPTLATSTTYIMCRKSASPEYLVLVGVEAGNLLMRKVENGVVSDTTITYDPVLHRWLRLRHDGTTLYWESSTNGQTWTTRRSGTTTVDLTDLEITIESQWQGTAGTSPYAELGWLNVKPTSRLASSTLTAFGTLRTVNDIYTDKADDEYGVGTRVGMYEAFWDRAEGAANGTFSSSYGTQVTSETNLIRNTGAKLTLGLGLGYPPSWTSTLTNARLVNESAVTDTTVLNYMFSQAVRDEAEDYIDWLNTKIPFQNVWAIRISAGSGGELLYPSGGLWGYDTAAQGGSNRPATIRPCPHPAWTPGTGTVAQATAFYEWYLDALADVARWQMAYIRSKGFTGWFEILTPGVGTLASGLATELTNRLTGYSATTGVGAVWHKLYARLSLGGVVAYCSSVGDNSGSPTNNVSAPGDTSVAITSGTLSTWSAQRIVARMGKEFCAAESGENPGWGGFGEFNTAYYTGTGSTGLMATSLDQAEASSFLAFYWAHSAEFYNGNFPGGLSAYASQISTQNSGSFPTPSSPPAPSNVSDTTTGFLDPRYELSTIPQTPTTMSFAHTPPSDAKYGIVSFAAFIGATTNSTPLVYGLTGVQAELPANLAPDISGFRDQFNWQVQGTGTASPGVGTDPTTSYLPVVWGVSDVNMHIAIPHLIPGDQYTATVEAQKVGTQPNVLFSADEGQTGALINTTSMATYTITFTANESEQDLQFILQGTPTATEGLRVRKLNVQAGTGPVSLATSAVETLPTTWVRPKDMFEGWVERWPVTAGSSEITITVVDRMKRLGAIDLSSTLQEAMMQDVPGLLMPLTDSLLDSPGRFSQLGSWSDQAGGPTYVDISKSRGDIGASSYTTNTDDGPTGEASLKLSPSALGPSSLGYFLAIPFSKDYIAPSSTPVVLLSQPTPAQPSTYIYTKRWYATWSRSYDSTNATRFDDSAFMYQGSNGGAPGIQKSLAGFDYKNIMSVLQNATILEVFITVQNDHSQRQSGLYVAVGSHNYATKPSTWTAGNVRTSRWRPRVGEGQAVTVSAGITFGNELKAGTSRGITIGPESSIDNYGYFRGATQGGKPYITVNFKK